MKIFLIDLINRNPLIFAWRQFINDIDSWHDFFCQIQVLCHPKRGDFIRGLIFNKRLSYRHSEIWKATICCPEISQKQASKN